MHAEKVWEQLGQTDPYWAVVTDQRFHASTWDNRAQEDFFNAGATYVEKMLCLIHERFGFTATSKRVLDFGCGVGRLVIPLAQRCGYVTGVDIAESMLQKAQVHIEAAGLTNVELIKGDDDLSRVSGSFDLVHSYIVFQHIPSAKCRRFVQRLLELLAGDGIPALHFCYSKTALAHDWPDAAPSFNDSVLQSLRNALSTIWYKLKQLAKKVIGRVEMKMYPTTLNPIFHLLQQNGIRRMHLEFTDHNGELGVAIFFQKPREPIYWM